MIHAGSSKKKRRNTIIFYTILLFLLTISSVILAEVTLRVLSDYLPEGVKLRIHWQEMGRQSLKSIAHPYIGFLYPPNSTAQFERGDLKFKFSTDSKGFRNKEPNLHQADIVVVGDSLGFGYGVNDGQDWVSIIQKYLPQTNVVNLSLIGSGPEQYKRVYETFGLNLKPKILIVSLFPDNDFWDSYKFNEWLTLGAKGNYDAFRLFGKEDFAPTISIKSIVKKTYFYMTLKELYQSIKSGTLMNRNVITFKDGGRIQLVPGQLENQKRMMNTKNIGFKLSLESIYNIKNITDSNNTSMFVLIFPSKESVYALQDLNGDILKPLKNELGKLNIPYFDLTPSFKIQAKKGLKIFYEVDGHPNQKGYEIAAEQTMHYLKKTYGY
jgi:hypothetical protein